MISSYDPPLLPRCLPSRFASVAAPPWSRSAHQLGVSRRRRPVARRSGMRIGHPVSGSPNFAASDESYGVGQVGDGDANAPVGGFRFVRWRRSRPGGRWPKVTSARFDPACNSLRGARGLLKLDIAVRRPTVRRRLQTAANVGVCTIAGKSRWKTHRARSCARALEGPGRDCRILYWPPLERNVRPSTCRLEKARRFYLCAINIWRRLGPEDSN